MVRPRRIPHEDEVRAVVRDEIAAAGAPAGDFASKGHVAISNLSGTSTTADVANKLNDVMNILRTTGIIAADRF